MDGSERGGRKGQEEEKGRGRKDRKQGSEGGRDGGEKGKLRPIVGGSFISFCSASVAVS